ncbi:MAG: HEPN domain-containing protein [Phycisphaerae bacterium]
MTAPREEVVRKVQQWALYADDDLRLAQHGLSMGSECPYRLVAYHAQQCAEKYLKAYLVLQGVDFPFTHNISLLLELCEDSAGWVSTLYEAERLSRYAITTRYPHEDRDVSVEHGRQAIDLAVRVRDIVRTELIRAGIDL